MPKKLVTVVAMVMCSIAPINVGIAQSFTHSVIIPYSLDLDPMTNSQNARRVTVLSFVHSENSPSSIPTTQEPNEQLYRDFMLSLLSPYIQKAINDFYSKPKQFELFSARILNLKRLQPGSFWFEITVRVRTFEGAHNPPYGIETITLTNHTKHGRIHVLKYVHQDDPIPFLSPVPSGRPDKAVILPPNFVSPPDIEAQNVLLKWVGYVNAKKYDQATDVFTTETSDRELPEHWTYLKNIEQVSVLQYKDITSDFGGIPMDLSRFHAIKVYVAVLDYQVRTKKNAGVMIGKKLQRIFVVKKSPADPWRIFMMQGYPTFGALKSWGLDLRGVTNYGAMYRPDENLTTSIGARCPTTCNNELCHTSGLWILL